MEKNKQNVRKGIFIGSMVSAALLLGFLGSYAYFISTENNNQNQNANVQTGNMELLFEDGNNGINESLNFGESITKTFTIENTGSAEATGRIKWKNLVNTYIEGSLTYTFSYSESEDGEYKELVTNKKVPVSDAAITKTLASKLTIPVGTTYYCKLTITLNYLEDIDQTPDLKAILSTEFMLEEATGVDIDDLEGSDKVLATLNLKAKERSPVFADAATTDETVDGLYTMEDDYGTSYYFRGAVENNYVKFGGFYWRIIRINGDGSLRIIYDGEQAYANGVSDVGRSAFNSSFNPAHNDAKYLGYMYGASSNKKEEAQSNEIDSTAKTKLEEWYKTNIEDNNLSKYIQDTIFCNDRSTSDTPKTWASWDTALGYGLNPTAYGGYNRGNTFSPSLICLQQNDRFTVKDTKRGNGKLKYPIGLITIDEVIIAGGANEKVNKNFYLYKGHYSWTMSPGTQYTDKYADLIDIHPNGYPIIAGRNVQREWGISPVINIKPEYANNISGIGNMNDPYIIG